jgi:hypothetical protein
VPVIFPTELNGFATPVGFTNIAEIYDQILCRLSYHKFRSILNNKSVLKYLLFKFMGFKSFVKVCEG